MERIENLQELASALEEAKAWKRGAGSDWGTSGPTEYNRKKNVWTKGGYHPHSGKEMTKGVEGRWVKLPNGKPIFIVTKRPKTKAPWAKTTKGGRLAKAIKRVRAAKAGWTKRKANRPADQPGSGLVPRG
jgi:hypothetical protein